MDSFPVALSPKEFRDLNGRFPTSSGSGDIGKRALAIVQLHFQRSHPGCTFVKPKPGADLAVIIDAVDARQFEVKGTAARTMAWAQLKVSSKASYELLSNGASVLRVTDVYGRAPVVYELRCGVDFRLEPEARWSVKPVPKP
jgi:hypothetical protein